MTGSQDAVASLVRPQWGPLRHVNAGWHALDEAERALVQKRLEDVLSQTRFPPEVPRDALLRFFSFLAQVETIAIEIPMRFLPHAPDHQKPALRRQLVDEVFHSVLFSRLAHELARPAAEPAPPLESAERLLERIRAQKDLAVTATLLNLAAEGWIENLFRHARQWGIADAAFQAVLEDEARHVHEATDYTEQLDADAAAAALEDLEKGLIEVGSEPSVAFAMMQIAGVDRYHALIKDLHKNHVRHLKLVGLTPSNEWTEATQALEETTAEAVHDEKAPVPIEDTVWRQAARHVWSSPRDPTMQGEFTVPVGHFPRRAMTPLFIAAVGRAWAKNPELNTVLAQGRRWRLPTVQVGVRVMLADDELATVVIPEADIRSLDDIAYMLQDGMKQLQAMKEHRPPDSDRPEAVQSHLDTELLKWAPPGPLNFAVSVSNVGRFGLEAGAGCFTGNYSPSTDLTIGQRRRMPAWRTVAYLPQWQVRVGALQDHRVFDGNQAGLAMQAIKDELTPKAVRALRKVPDSLPEDKPEPVYDEKWMSSLPPGLQALPAVSFVKYSPLVIGGTIALGTGLGIGGFFLYRALAGGAGAAAASGLDLNKEKPAGENLIDDEQKLQASPVVGTCPATGPDGKPCMNPPVPGQTYCARHRK